jgi:hypothetical protein
MGRDQAAVVRSRNVKHKDVMMDRVKQHYVPQFLLRNFTTQDYLFVYDKYTDKTYTAAIRKIAAE